MTIYRSRRRLRWLALLALLTAVALAFVLHGSGGAQAIDASAFSSGACVAYSPTSGNRGETVVAGTSGAVEPGVSQPGSPGVSTICGRSQAVTAAFRARSKEPSRRIL